MPTRLAINGAAGRMGRRLVALASEDDALSVAAALEHAGSAHLDTDAGELAGVSRLSVPITPTLDPAADVDVMIDFSLPDGTRAALDVCIKHKIAMVVGTTGLESQHHAAIDEAARHVAIVQAPNMSLGVNLLFKLAAQVAATLGDDFDIEITEAHHRYKKDAPSGTAMGIAEHILEAQHKSKDRLIYGRAGNDTERQRGDIGMHSLRVGDETGRHTVHYGQPGERIELTHVATSRDTFVKGALRAASWVAGQTPGRYSMADVLGL